MYIGEWVERMASAKMTSNSTPALPHRGREHGGAAHSTPPPREEGAVRRQLLQYPLSGFPLL